jgi:uncharacterized membrane protein YdbT with pleckstrin-like domain
MRTKLKNDEEIMLLTKKHWLPILIYPICLMIVATVLAFKVAFLNRYFSYLALSTVFFLLYKILERNYNTWIVSNLRVIEETGIFTRITMECPLDKINNVSYSQNIWGRIFRFGNVVIQTAAQHGATVYYNVEHPQLLKETITTMQEEYRKSGWKEQTLAMANLFSHENKNTASISVGSEIEKLFELKQKGILTETEYNSLKYKVLAFDNHN